MSPAMSCPYAGLDRVTEGAWQSGRWIFRESSLFLIPGDSPMGLRLPLDALPHVPEGEIETDHERDPFEPREPWPAGIRRGGDAGRYRRLAPHYPRAHSAIGRTVPRSAIHGAGGRCPD